MKKPKVIVSWSSGKDCAWTLFKLIAEKQFEVVGLIANFNLDTDKVAMHGCHRDLVLQQATTLELPLYEVKLPWPCTNKEYELRMNDAFGKVKADGITHIAFGDLFLEDIRDYRIRTVQVSGLKPLFPIWCDTKSTLSLAKEMIETGFRAKLICVDPKQLPVDFTGREFDNQLLSELPLGVDPCGENGEFHTFCYDGPIFKKPIAFQSLGRQDRDGFCYMDLVPTSF